MPNRRLHAAEPPLYDPAFEHDACGVGFVADASRANADRVLPLALAGLGALGHRGAFAADGESSDGAGILFDITPAYLERIVAPGGPRRRAGDIGIVMLFCARAPGPQTASVPVTDAAAEDASRAIVQAALVEGGLAFGGWRDVPVDATVLGPEAAATLPPIAQAFVPRPGGISRTAFERSLVLARRRIEARAREAGLHELAVVSASAETVVYKALVARRSGRRVLPGPRTRAAGSLRALPPALRDEHAPGLAARPAVRPDRAQRRDQHRARAIARKSGDERPISARPHSRAGSPRSDRSYPRTVRTHCRSTMPSSSSRPRAGAWTRRSSRSFRRPRACRRARRATRRKRAIRAVGRPGRARVRRWPESRRAARPQRASPGGVRRDEERPRHARIRGGGRTDRGGGDRSARAPRAGRPARRRPRDRSRARGRGCQGRRRGGRRRGDARSPDVRPADRPDDRRPHRRCARSRRPRESADRACAQVPRRSRRRTAPSRHQDHRARRPRAAVEHGRRHADPGHRPHRSPGRRPPPAVVRPGHEPADRPGARAHRHGPLGRARPAADAARWPAARAADAAAPASRSIVDVDRSGGSAAGPTAATVRTLDATWSAADGPDGSRAGPSIASPAAPWARHAAVRTIVAISDRRLSLERLPVPSVLAAGAVHTALTAAGLRGRTDVVVEAADVLDRPRARHGARVRSAGSVHPWLAIELAAEVAGSSAAPRIWRPTRRIGNLADGLEAGLRKTLARMGISTVATYVGGQFFEVLELSPAVLERCFPAAPAWPGRVELTDLAARQLRRRAAAADARRAPRAAVASRTQASPGSAPTASRISYAPSIAARDPGPRGWPDAGCCRGRRRRSMGRTLSTKRSHATATRSDGRRSVVARPAGGREAGPARRAFAARPGRAGARRSSAASSRPP